MERNLKKKKPHTQFGEKEGTKKLIIVKAHEERWDVIKGIGTIKEASVVLSWNNGKSVLRVGLYPADL